MKRYVQLVAALAIACIGQSAFAEASASASITHVTMDLRSTDTGDLTGDPINYVLNGSGDGTMVSASAHDASPGSVTPSSVSTYTSGVPWFMYSANMPGGVGAVTDPLTAIGQTFMGPTGLLGGGYLNSTAAAFGFASEAAASAQIGGPSWFIVVPSHEALTLSFTMDITAFCSGTCTDPLDASASFTLGTDVRDLTTHFDSGAHSFADDGDYVLSFSNTGDTDVELLFTAATTVRAAYDNYYNVTNGIDPTGGGSGGGVDPVPEPNTIMLSLIGGLLVLVTAKRKLNGARAAVK